MITIEEIAKSPKLPYILEQLNKIIKEEQKKRSDFYNTINKQQKAEFINGEIILHSPVRNIHATVSGRLFALLLNYVLMNDLGYVGHEKLLISLTRNDYEPDVCYFSKSKATLFSNNQLKHPAPDFVAEILSPSTAEIDRTIKFEDYAFHGVQEYWIIDPDEKILEQYILKDKTYQLHFKANNGSVISSAIAGFQLYLPALFQIEDYLIESKKI
jgi:Uma2 family endonuclease